MKLKPVALSLSQAEIDEIATELLEAMQPDWQNAISLIISQFPYTAPADGAVMMSVNSSSQATGGAGDRKVYVNGQEVANIIAAIQGVGARPTDLYLPLAKGDIVSFSNSNADINIRSGHFVPNKTSNPVSLRPLDPHKIDTAILNHWDDITSDFSTAGSTAGFVLDRVAYNPILRKLRVNYHTTASWAANTTKYFILTYNGSDLPAFTRTCFYGGSMTLEAAAAGYEDSYIVQQANKLSIDVYNRNGSTAWPAGVAFTVQVEF